MINELEFKNSLKEMNRDQLESFAYTLALEKDKAEENYGFLKRQLYGTHHNAKNPHVSIDQLSLFNEMEVAVDHPEEMQESPESEEPDSSKVGKYRTANRYPMFYSTS